MGTCTYWHGAVAAGRPELWPAAVLACLAPDFESLAGGYWADTVQFEKVYAAGVSDVMDLLRQAARMPPHTLRVRVEGTAQVRGGTAV